MKALGEYLVGDGVLTRDQVERVLVRQSELRASGSRWAFGEVVVLMGLASAGQIQRALDHQQRERSERP